MALFALTLHHREAENSPASQATSKALSLAGLDLGKLEAKTCYLIETREESKEAALQMVKLLQDPVLESAEIFQEKIPKPATGTQLVVMRKPGVMDPVEASVLKTLKLGGFEVLSAKVLSLYLFARELTETEHHKAAKNLSNQVVEDAHFGAFPLKSLDLGKQSAFKRVEVNIRTCSHDELENINKHHALSMNLEEMEAVQTYFRKLEREPSDIELEMIAQTWSEHCKHKTLTDPVEYREGPDVKDSLFKLTPELFNPGSNEIPGLLQTTIKRATDIIIGEYQEETTETDPKELPHKKDFCLSLFSDNAGVIAFDEHDGVCIKVETHNHPSALEPYGGSGTGIGGVIRDILGTGLGAEPLMNTDVFCLGFPDMPQDDVPQGALHPLRTLRGVVSGVRDYGNRMGIPTVNGAFAFDQRYTANPLVYAGCIGIIPRKYVHKAVQSGDKIVCVGGRTGRDGIGGATFSSTSLHEESEIVSATAVQIGNPIQEKIVLDAMLLARDQELYNAVTDCGAGGFSSAIGEMGETTGARVELSELPLKYQGLSYREIWLSEAQERMVFAVPPQKLEAFCEIFASHDVECSVCGDFTDDRHMIVHYQGQEVLNLSMEFLHDGRPRRLRKALWQEPERTLERSSQQRSYQDALMALLAHPTLCSKEWVVRQYDHEVQGLSALKPFVGKYHDGPSDAAAIIPKPLEDAKRTLLVGCGLQPHLSDLDPYWMAQTALDEALRNVVCAGGDIEHVAILDNFSWGNCEKPQELAALARACAGCYVAAKALGVPFISGKDSLNNEFLSDGKSVAIPGTLLITALSVSSFERLTSMDFKAPGNLLYQLGTTAHELAGSYYEMLEGSQADSSMPRYQPKNALKLYRLLGQAQSAGLIRSAHDCSEGGLALALAEMAFAGGFGAEISLDKALAHDSSACQDHVLLFAESNNRIIIEVQPKDQQALLKLFSGTPITKLGSVQAQEDLCIQGLEGDPLIKANIEELRKTWKQPLYQALGESLPV